MIGIEQLDIQALAEVFVLRSELKGMLGRDYILEILKSLTIEEKEDLGLIPIDPRKARLKELVALCQNLLANAEVGNDIDQYPQIAVTTFQVAIHQGVNYIKMGTLEEMDLYYPILDNARKNFLKSIVIEPGMLIDGKWYGYFPPTDSSIPWVPMKILKKKYWVSLEPINVKYPNSAAYIHIYGLYYDGKIFTRSQLPTDLSLYEKVDGAVYDKKWFSVNEKPIFDLTEYLKTTIMWIPSNYIAVKADPPLIPRDGEAWNGDSVFMDYLPSSTAIMENVFKIVCRIGSEVYDNDDILVLSPTLLVNNQTNQIVSASFIEPITADSLRGHIITLQGNTTEVITSEIEGTKALRVTSKNKSNSKTYNFV